MIPRRDRLCRGMLVDVESGGSGVGKHWCPELGHAGPYAGAGFSSFRYRGGNEDLQRVSEQLGARRQLYP
jgi:hypothetical protein